MNWVKFLSANASALPPASNYASTLTSARSSLFGRALRSIRVSGGVYFLLWTVIATSTGHGDEAKRPSLVVPDSGAHSKKRVARFEMRPVPRELYYHLNDSLFSLMLECPESAESLERLRELDRLLKNESRPSTDDKKVQAIDNPMGFLERLKHLRDEFNFITGKTGSYYSNRPIFDLYDPTDDGVVSPGANLQRLRTEAGNAWLRIESHKILQSIGAPTSPIPPVEMERLERAIDLARTVQSQLLDCHVQAENIVRHDFGKYWFDGTRFDGSSAQADSALAILYDPVRKARIQSRRFIGEKAHAEVDLWIAKNFEGDVQMRDATVHLKNTLAAYDEYQQNYRELIRLLESAQTHDAVQKARDRGITKLWWLESGAHHLTAPFVGGAIAAGAVALHRWRSAAKAKKIVNLPGVNSTFGCASLYRFTRGERTLEAQSYSTRGWSSQLRSPRYRLDDRRQYRETGPAVGHYHSGRSNTTDGSIWMESGNQAFKVKLNESGPEWINATTSSKPNYRYSGRLTEFEPHTPTTPVAPFAKGWDEIKPTGIHQDWRSRVQNLTHAMRTGYSEKYAPTVEWARGLSDRILGRTPLPKGVYLATSRGERDGPGKDHSISASVISASSDRIRVVLDPARGTAKFRFRASAHDPEWLELGDRVYAALPWEIDAKSQVSAPDVLKPDYPLKLVIPLVIPKDRHWTKRMLAPDKAPVTDHNLKQLSVSGITMSQRPDGSEIYLSSNDGRIFVAADNITGEILVWASRPGFSPLSITPEMLKDASTRSKSLEADEVIPPFEF